MALGADTAAVEWSRTRLDLPGRARAWEESTTARDQSARAAVRPGHLAQAREDSTAFPVR